MRNLEIAIVVENGKAVQKLVEVDQALTNVGKSAKKSGEEVDKAQQLTVAGYLKSEAGLKALEEGTKRIIEFARGSVTAFAEQETALHRVTTALITQGMATPAVITQYEQLASTFEHTTRFSDELVSEMEALLIQVGNVMPAQMKAALTAATDLSAGLGIDLRTATLLVGKAFEGETGTLKRYGIVIDENALKVDAAGAVQDAIQKKFGGQAQAELETYAGKVKHATNEWNNFEERVGGLVATVLTPLLDIFEKLPAGIQNVIFVVGSLTTLLTPLAVGGQLILSAFGSSLLGAFTTLGGFLTATIIPLIGTALPAALQALAFLVTPPVGLVIAGIVAVATVWKHWDTIKPIVIGVYNTVKEYLVDKFAAIVNYIGEKVNDVTGFFKDMYDKVVGRSYVPDMVTGIGDWFGKLPALMVNPTKKATDTVGGLFRTLTAELNSVFKAAFEGGGGIGGAVKSLATTATSAVLGLIPGIGPILSQFGGAIVAGFSKLGGFFKGLFGFGGDKKAQTTPAIDAINAAATKHADDVAKGMSDILAAAKDLGGNVPAALQPLIEALAHAKGLTDDQATALLGIANGPSLPKIIETAGKYGLTLDDLGSKTQQLSISTRADEIVTDFGLLVDSGAEYGNTVNHFAGKIQGLVTDAMKYGSTLPTALEPIALALVNSGQLTDLAGDKLHDLSGIKFDDSNDPLAQSLDKLTKAIDHLGELLGGLPGAAATAASGIGNAFSGVDISIPVRFDVENKPDFERFHSGGAVLPFVRAHRGLAIDEVPIVALRGEGVLNRGAMRSIGGPNGLNALNAGGSRSSGPAVTVNVNVDGYIDSPAAQRNLARIVNEQTMRAIERRSRAS